MLEILFERCLRPGVKTSLDDKVEECGERLASLSERERSVLDQSLTGQSDEQIAQALDIRIATVGSYWARIRGKMGHYSRTELVSLVLRYQARQECAQLAAENDRLKQALHERQGREGPRDSHSNGAPDHSWHLKAFDNSPQATFVIAPQGDICFANIRAKELYAADGQEMRGLPIRDLTMANPQGGNEEEVVPCKALLEAGSLLHEETIGYDLPFYARRRNGTNFRAVLHSRRFSFAESAMAILVVHEYLKDMELALEALRRPLRAESMDFLQRYAI